MKLSCLPVSFFQEIISSEISVLDWAEIGKNAGLDAVDLSILFLSGADDTKLEQIRRGLSKIDMRIAMITSYPDFTHPDALERERQLELEVGVVRVAKQIGAEMVRVTAGQAHPGLDRQNGIQWAVEGLSKLAERTAGWGIDLVYENHSKPGAWQYTDFSEPPDIFLEIAQQVKQYGVGINFDAGNAAAFSDDPVALLNKVIDNVVSIHASDTQEVGVLKHVLVGTGVTPYTEVFHTLKEYGWDGWICIEEASFLGEEGVKKAAQYVRSCWETA